MKKTLIEVLRYENQDVIATSAPSLCASTSQHLYIASSDQIVYVNSGANQYWTTQSGAMLYDYDGAGNLTNGQAWTGKWMVGFDKNLSPSEMVGYYIYNGSNSYTKCNDIHVPQ